jgi:hypothetical protein
MKRIILSTTKAKSVGTNGFRNNLKNNMEINLFFKIASTLFAIGLIGCVVNEVRAADPKDWRNHTYSSIPLSISVLCIIGRALEYIWSQ